MASVHWRNKLAPLIIIPVSISDPTTAESHSTSYPWNLCVISCTPMSGSVSACVSLHVDGKEKDVLYSLLLPHTGLLWMICMVTDGVCVFLGVCVYARGFSYPCLFLYSVYMISVYLCCSS